MRHPSLLQVGGALVSTAMVARGYGGGQRSQYEPRHAARRAAPDSTDQGVESNARLTGATAVVLLVLFAIEGATLLGIRAHLSIHVFVGTMLIPPVVLKVGSTTWRFVKYYSGSPVYRRKGPPPALLRALGPVLVVLTIILLGSGIALVFSPNAAGGRLLFIHKASFVLWFGVMVIHVLGHILETAKLAPLDWVRRSRSQVAGASARQWTLAASLAVGLVLGALMLGPASHYLGHGVSVHHFGRR